MLDELNSIEKIPFFHDFLFFLNTLKTRSLQLTKTGNLKRQEIDYLGSHFKVDIYDRNEQGEIIYPIYTEDEVLHLIRIRKLAQAMYLTYFRSGELRLTKNGQGYLTRIDAHIQFEQMVLWYFNRCNWTSIYYHLPDAARILQKNQAALWKFFLQHQDTTIDFPSFAKLVGEKFYLTRDNPYRDPKWAIGKIIVLDLSLMGLVNYTSEESGHLHQIVSFHPTRLGLQLFETALTEPF